MGLYGETSGAKRQAFGPEGSLELAEGTTNGRSHSVMDPSGFVEKVSVFKVLYLSTFHLFQEEEYLCILGLCYLG